MTALLLAVALLGALISGPAWMTYALKQERKRREWEARRQERRLRQ
jgi:hypothetical protein